MEIIGKGGSKLNPIPLSGAGATIIKEAEMGRPAETPCEIALAPSVEVEKMTVVLGGGVATTGLRH